MQPLAILEKVGGEKLFDDRVLTMFHCRPTTTTATTTATG